MTPQQKISTIALGVFAAAAITLGLLHVHQGILASVAWNPGAKNIEELDAQKNKKDDLSELQGKDTDNDGLNDYEELQVFGTSPYLKDTDGDNLDDAKEIQAGTDPNCPEGKKCAASATEDKKIAGEDAGNPLLAGMPADMAVPENIKQLQALLTGENVTPAQVREILAQGGVGADVLGKVDDATLMKLYSEVLKQFREKGTAGVQGGATLDLEALGLAGGASTTIEAPPAQ